MIMREDDENPANRTEINFSPRLHPRHDLDFDALTETIRSAVDATLKAEGSTGRVSVLVTDDEEIRELNRNYLDHDYPTDVISFSMIEGEPIASPEDAIIGDVAVSVDTAMRQSIEYGTSFTDEVALLIVHGVLHILGYDDQDDDSRAVMRARESEILDTIKEVK